MNAKTRKAINNGLYEATKGFHDAIPLQAINDILKKHDYQLLQEDGEPFQGILCGDNSDTLFPIGDHQRTNSHLWLGWYRFSTGRYEITTYLT